MASKALAPLALATAALASGPAQSATHLSLTFDGVVSPGFGLISIYSTSETPVTSFDGQPMRISLSLTRQPGAVYVDHVSASWSDDAYDFPFLTGWDARGFPSDPAYDSANGVMSNVSLSPAGGSISLSTTDGFNARFDADFVLAFDYAFNSPHGRRSGRAVTGSGSFDAYANDYRDPRVGDYTALSNGSFTLSSVMVEGVPEPAAWLIMIAGFGGIGTALRRRNGASRTPTRP